MRWVMLCGLLLGCEASVADVDPVSDRVVELPVVPIRQIPAHGSVVANNPEPGVDLAVSGYLVLGYGLDYPSDLTLVKGEIWQGRTECDGTFVPEELSSSDEAVVVSTIQDGAVTMEVTGVGSAQMQVSGTFTGRCSYDPSAPSRTYAVQWTYEVAVVEPAEVELFPPGACGRDTPLSLLGGAPLVPGWAARVVREDGYAWTMHNAQEDRQIHLTLRVTEGLGLRGPTDNAEFGAIELSGDSGTLSVEARTGATWEFPVHEAADVDAIDLQFLIPWGDFGRDVILEDGQTYNFAELYQFSPDRNLVMLNAGLPRVGDALACNLPDPAWFDFTATPGQTELGAPEFQDNNEPYVLPVGAEITGTGPVTLTAEAPSLNGGAGLGAEVSVLFQVE